MSSWEVTMAKKETKAEREARWERMSTAPARQRAFAEEYHRQRAERERQRKSQS
jgi:hypothetical protein